MWTRREFIVEAAGATAAIAAAGPALLLEGCTHSAAIPAVTPAVLPASFHDVAGSRSLRAHARRYGLVFGSAVIIHNVQSDPDFAEVISEQCGIVVPTGELKWIALRPAPDRYDFSRPDFLLQFAKKNRMLMRGHTLCWHESVPEWIQTPENRPKTRQFFVDHITTVCKHFAGQLQSWDVVNEAILPKDGQPGGLQKSFWYDQIGPDYIDLAFRTARAADPHAKLTYNDYGVEYDNDDSAERRRLILELLRGMQKRGVPLDAVGIQSHVKAAQPYKFGKGLA